MLQHGVQIRRITDDEVPAYRRSMMATFGGDVAADPQGDDRLRALIRPGRAFGAFDGDVCVATGGTFEQTVSVPGGGDLVMAGLTMVSVRPTHRRRGILRGLIELHLADARDHGEPISGLWASEAGIYGRFGYGIACESDDLHVDVTGLDVAVGHELDTVEDLDGNPETMIDAIAPVFDAMRANRPGMISRSPAWWTWRRFKDRDDQRRGASPRRHVVARRAGAIVGYLASRQKLEWTEGGIAKGSYLIDELIATDPRAEITLWKYAASIDLFPKVSYWNAPADALLPWISSDPRRARRVRTDSMWIRVEDVATALAARRYAHDGRLTLAIEDGPAFALEIEDGIGLCAATDRAPELVLARPALGSLLLGGTSPGQLARAGLASGTGLAVAERLFPWPVPPWCAEIF